jgi:hypothetical protein
MAITPCAPYFYIRINKEVQNNRKEKIGSLYVPPDYVFMKRNMQCGEILAIGTAAHEYFPEAKVGDILICHHLVESITKTYLIDSDEYFNYYVVQAFEVPGERNVTYGVWNGTEIIPNKDYIFLEIETVTTDLPDLEVQSNLKGEGSWKVNIPMTVSEGGLFIPKPVKKTREELTAITKKNMERIKQLSNNQNRMTHEVVDEIKKLEGENLQISKQINKREYEPYKIACIGPGLTELLLQIFGHEVRKGDTLYVLNIAAQMRVEFLGKEYIIAENKYIGAPEKWLKDSVRKFNFVS